MNGNVFEQFGVACIHLVAIIFLIWRIVRARTIRSRQIMIKTLIVFLLLLLTSYNISQERAHQSIAWWLYIVGNLAMLAAGVLGYFLIEQMFDDHISQSLKDIATHKATIVTMILASFMVLVDYQRRQDLVSIWSVSDFERSWLHASSFTLFSASSAYVGILAVRLQRYNFVLYTEPYIRCRTLIVILGYVVGILICVIGTINTIMSIIFDNPYRVAIYSITQHAGVPTVFFLLAFGCIPPFSFYQKLLQPVQYYREIQQQRQKELLNQLHEFMITIAPIVHLKDTRLDDQDKLIEIIDAREVILSQVPYRRLLTPLEEAEQLCGLFRTQNVISAAGEHLHPPIHDDKTIKHMIEVARWVIRLQQRTPSKPDTHEVPST